jgi:hypothetical protein
VRDRESVARDESREGQGGCVGEAQHEDQDDRQREDPLAVAMRADNRGGVVVQASLRMAETLGVGKPFGSRARGRRLRPGAVCEDHILETGGTPDALVLVGRKGEAS